MTTSTDTMSSRRDRGFIALLLVSGGALMLAGRAVPTAGSAVAMLIGIELLVWAVAARSVGLVVAGGTLTGVGAAIVLAAGPLRGADPNQVGAVFLLALAAGFAIVALVSWLLLRQPQYWAWICGFLAGAIGAGLLDGPERAAAVVGWALPVALTIAGIAVAVHWLRAR